MNNSKAHMVISARIAQAMDELQAALRNIANSDYAEVYKNLTYADNETRLIKRRFRELFRSPRP
ncbi:hypothetical protein SQV56_000394 [Salmonella enterica]|nr:hypothetical protein [Salmonella enterica subsp. diarizonae]EJB6559578.1 hypothetical protein [Salmonella enterica]ELZ0448143.1 hypothetical protein [Salmonella enterica]